MAFRLLGAGNFPEHRTIRDFRAFHLKELSELFVQVVKAKNPPSRGATMDAGSSPA